MKLSDRDWSQGLAVIGSPDGFFVGFGPFTSAETPHGSDAWVYWTDFEGRNARPWLKPNSFAFYSAQEIADEMQVWAQDNARMPDISWQDLDKSAFRRDFDQIQSEIETGRVEKVVPTVVERGRLESGRHEFLVRLLEHLTQSRSTELFAYFIVQGNRAFGGLSPEILFESPDGRHFKTHAVAGTQKRGERPAVAFLNLSKEAHEHDLVIAGLSRDLGEIGVRNLKLETKVVRVLPTLEHLETPMSFEADASIATRLLKKLHPTPALGVFPKTPRALGLLHGLEAARGRESHGAPVGYLLPTDGICRFVVGIRCVQLDGNGITLAAGCGVTARSDFESEWLELENKRNSVKRWFGSAPTPIADAPSP